MRVFYFANNDDTVKTAYAVNVAEGVEHEVLIVFHVVCIHFDLKIIVARGVVAFRYLVYVLHSVHELLYQVVSVLLQSDIA